MELINNTTKTLKDDLSVEIKQGSKVSIAAACFSIYAFQELKEQLSQIEQLRFIFTSPTFVTEKAKKERREFYIPRMTRERSLYGTEFEIKLRNELTQKAIARECAEWIRQKVNFKSNVSDKSIQGQIVVDGVGYTPINNFTTVELGCEKGNVISTTIVKDESLARTLLADFNEIWNDSKVLQIVTDEVIDSITAAYNENSPDFIYFVTLYNIFNEFLEDVSEDVLPNEAKAKVETRMKIVDMTATGDDNLLSDEEKTDLEYRKAQLKRLQDEVVDIEDMTTGISIMDLGLNEFRLDLLDYIKHHPDIDKTPFGLHSVVPASEDTPAGVIYVLKNRSNSVNIDNQNRLHPFYMVYIGNDGEVICDHLSPKQMLDKMRFLCKGKTEPIPEAYKPFNKETRDGKDMSRFSKLLGDAIASIIEVKDESDIDSFLGGGQVSFLSNEIKGLDDFELICFLVIRN